MSTVVPSYEGSKEGRLRHGEGAYVYEYPAFRYDGQWRHGVKHGRGKLALPDGSTYEGDFIEGEIIGQGTRSWLDGSSYEGGFQHGERHGKGSMRYRDGSVYEGDWVEQLRHGQGTWTTPQGRQYTGDWAQHRFHGKGRLTYEDGGHYDGDFHHGKRQGEGNEVLANGSSFSGSWLDDQRSGEGCFQCLATGIQYHGPWAESLPTRSATSMACEPSAGLAAEPGKPLPTLKVSLLAEAESMLSEEPAKDEPSLCEGEHGRMISVSLAKATADQGGDEVREPLYFFAERASLLDVAEGLGPEPLKELQGTVSEARRTRAEALDAAGLLPPENAEESKYGQVALPGHCMKYHAVPGDGQQGFGAEEGQVVEFGGLQCLLAPAQGLSMDSESTPATSAETMAVLVDVFPHIPPTDPQDGSSEQASKEEPGEEHDEEEGEGSEQAPPPPPPPPSVTLVEWCGTCIRLVLNSTPVLEVLASVSGEPTQVVWTLPATTPLLDAWHRIAVNWLGGREDGVRTLSVLWDGTVIGPEVSVEVAPSVEAKLMTASSCTEGLQCGVRMAAIGSSFRASTLLGGVFADWRAVEAAAGDLEATELSLWREETGISEEDEAAAAAEQAAAAAASKGKSKAPPQPEGPAHPETLAGATKVRSRCFVSRAGTVEVAGIRLTARLEPGDYELTLQDASATPGPRAGSKSTPQNPFVPVPRVIVPLKVS